MNERVSSCYQHVIDYLEENIPTAATLTPLQKIENEISYYLEYPLLNADADPLAWWRSENGQFLNLVY